MDGGAWSQHLLYQRCAEARMAHQLACRAAIHFFKDSNPLGALFRLLKVFSTVGVNRS